MQDACYGLVFSYAVDAFQDSIGFDTAYRDATGCTIYLVEDHKYFLREVKAGAAVQVETLVLGVDEKRFHLYMIMREGGEVVAKGEFMEMHVQQHPSPTARPPPCDTGLGKTPRSKRYSHHLRPRFKRITPA